MRNIQETIVQNQGLYSAALTELNQRGCPEELAKQAAIVVANDDSSKPDLGRNRQDQKVIQEALPYLRNQ
ncbi:hypothetical protein H6G76_33660 [Nostoc sp. FACHB-152]|uniref:hypothetical protein n=1 Tax=unclassified Nostoc TaxID=2593658 RepID=UPI001688B0ED|nr:MULTISPECIES: hypothetical protein [unclassified Nostoc]MBD2451978.1 hypothetical protein [Nostoc sp. FACHB-152]MBD2473403.1 hypothetical protein [Nostoc sp. FACHB-145]